MASRRITWALVILWTFLHKCPELSQLPKSSGILTIYPDKEADELQMSVKWIAIPLNLYYSFYKAQTSKCNGQQVPRLETWQ